MSQVLGTVCEGYIPEEVVFQILLWLPVVSLLRFKSVCKSWRYLIESSRFITRHLYHRDNHNVVALKEYRKFKDPSKPSRKGSYAGMFSFSGDRGNKLELLDLSPVFKQLRSHFGIMLTAMRVVGSCDGIVCLHREAYVDVFLWNPSTKQCRALPQPQSPAWPPKLFDHDPDLGAGFGFDDKTNDYKMVRFRLPPELDDYDFGAYIRLDTYSLSSNSWRVREDVVMPIGVESIDSSLKTPYQNGRFFCWLTYMYIHEELVYSILYFDFRNEVLGAVALPDNIKKNVGTLHLTITRGKIACINVVRDSSQIEKGLRFEIWILNEFGVQESWSNQYNIPIIHPKFDLHRPHMLTVWVVGFLKNGEFIFLKGRQIFSWDPVTQQVKCLLPGDQGCSEAAMYKESLLSIHPPQLLRSQQNGI